MEEYPKLMVTDRNDLHYGNPKRACRCSALPEYCVCGYSDDDEDSITFRDDKKAIEQFVYERKAKQNQISSKNEGIWPAQVNTFD